MRAHQSAAFCILGLTGAMILLAGASPAAANSSGPPAVDSGSALTLSPISDEQVSDCLVRIGEFPSRIPGSISPTPAFDELSALKTELYYEHPDSVGFLYAVNNDELNDPEGVATISVPTTAKFEEVWEKATRGLSTLSLKPDPRREAGTVREICGVFLDALDSGALSDSIRGASIDQRANRVVIFASDAKRVSEYVNETYGGLAIVEESGGEIEDSRDWSTGPFAAGQRIYYPGGSGWCTQAFNMRNGSGTPYTLTAAHCGNPGQQWHSAGFVGTTNNFLPGRDVAFVYGGNYNGRIFRGAWNTNATGSVAGVLSALPNPGNYAGFSGATTGESNAPYSSSGCFGQYCNLLFCTRSLFIAVESPRTTV